MAQKRSKNQIRREKAKLRKLENPQETSAETSSAFVPNEASKGISEDQEPLRTDLETASISSESGSTRLIEQFAGVFDRFKEHEEDRKETALTKDSVFSENESSSTSESESESEDEAKPLSKRQLRLQNKVPLAVLKASTNRPQLVDWHDVDARDPYMSVAMKAQPNVIQVPGHWSAKRDYLSGRRGLDKQPFQLPKFIRNTGIQDMRQPQELNLRQEQRNKVQPKMGRLDIDYQKLYDAFFKHQDQPRMFGFGEVYFEGKEADDEFLESTSEVKAGIVSPSLRKALEMPDNLKVVPPWIEIMQEIGRPPAYKNLIIPGLDVEYSNTGYKEKSHKHSTHGEYWGKLQEYVESSEEEEEDEEDEEDDDNKDEIIDQDNFEDDETVHYVDNKDEVEPTKVPISEIGETVDQARPVPSEDNNAEAKALYTVIDEQKINAGGVLNGNVGYDLGKESQTISQKTEINADQKAKKFKF